MFFFVAMIVKVAVAVVGGLIGWAYTRIKPPPPRICGSRGGPPITSPRVRLDDGRHLAYREWGVSKDEAKHKIIVSHGFDSSKDLTLPLSQAVDYGVRKLWEKNNVGELIEELQIYILSFDRAGYGESDPHPKRTVKSEAFDIQELADKLHIGPKFYVMGLSMGAYATWSCLKYIPHRLSGASLIVPFVNYWWPCLPADMAKKCFELLLAQDRWSFRVAHYAPWLFHWWMNQKIFPSLSMLAGKLDIFSESDLEFIKNQPPNPDDNQEKRCQQGVYECLYRDIMAGYGKWEFDPLDISNPWPDNNGAAHIWQGYEDRVIPYKISRFLSEKLPFVRYHEVPGKGHFLAFDSGLCEEIFRTLVAG
ncbi:putative alpha/beta hydrolase-1 [Helianthus anomalus]